ncbi:MAG: hypothetical protein R3208_14635, partial [Ketobacteraceae bacterium]|nr:hypothetical protein [Ketobacteraceae bacterium]
ITLDNGMNPTALGSTQSEDRQQALIVNRYSPDGTLQWNQTFPGYRHLTIGIDSHLNTDTENNTFVSGLADSDNLSPVFLAKINPNGEVLWQQELDTGHVVLPHDVAVDGNGNYLLLADGVRAFASADGTPLWHYGGKASCEETICDPEIDLDDYPYRRSSASLFALLELSVLDNGNIIANFGDSLHLLDTDGTLLRELQAVELGLARFDSLKDNGEKAVTLGSTNNQLSAFLLDENLNYQPILSFDSASGGIVSINNNAFICLAVLDGEQLNVHTIHGAESNLFSATISDTLTEPVAINTNNRNECYVSLFEQTERVYLRTRVINQKGRLKDTITINDFAAEAVMVNDRIVYSAGITGSYETTEGTRGTLFKHQVR